MGIPFTVYPLVFLVRYTVEGPVTPDDARRFLDAVLADPHYRRGFDFLGEGRTAGVPDAGYPEVLAYEVWGRAADLTACRWAVVAASPGGVALVRMRAVLTRKEGVEVAPFLTPEAALEWLGARTARITPPPRN